MLNKVFGFPKTFVTEIKKKVKEKEAFENFETQEQFIKDMVTVFDFNEVSIKEEPLENNSDETGVFNVISSKLLLQYKNLNGIERLNHVL